MKITPQQLKDKKACPEGIQYYINNQFDQLDWSTITEFVVDSQTEFNYAYWLVRKFKLPIMIGDKDGFWETHEYDQNNNLIKSEDSDGYWYKKQYDQNNNIVKFESLTGYIETRQYDQNNNLIKFEDSNGYIETYEYDQNNNLIKFEDSTGYTETY